MPERVFVDSNVFMYAAGAEHPLKGPSLAFLRKATVGAVQAVTSVEVLQEILHRYRRLNLPDVAATVYDLAVQICVEVLPVTIAETDVAVSLLAGSGGSVRDAIHASVMGNAGIEGIATFDVGFDHLGVRRVEVG